ncbi:protein kinase inhibitor [Schizosaccharomyces japonicus yFS275]|uniref:Protein kinase inhibitor n=1 Tax=Schizosaccharomyces japonicus (strain yFS275 / FY16936) TaxID=402676 RepID=B6K0R7_SCHJY|nr:protein kinase inhibitor [Schizosaccharomyces japonicus yFS275]EEB07538.1 protein kinase inhibitor [Schizosaccharomyces japonicus yFS275]
MHRAYSLRNSRAPTASQISNPPPPPSSTRSNKGIFGAGSFSHSVRKNAAATFMPELAKRLAVLVKMEKNVMRSMETVSRERRECARQLSYWGEDCDDDISDITDKLGVLFYELAELEDYLIDRHDQYRVTMKAVRNIEASVQPSREKKQKLLDQIYMLKHKDPESPKLINLEQELVREEAACLVAEAQLSNITREKFKQALTYNLDALFEHGEKMALIASYGKHLLNLIDDTPVTPGETRPAYDGYETSKQIIVDAERALSTWTSESAYEEKAQEVPSETRSWNEYDVRGEESAPVEQMNQLSVHDGQVHTSRLPDSSSEEEEPFQAHSTNIEVAAPETATATKPVVPAATQATAEAQVA